MACAGRAQWVARFALAAVLAIAGAVAFAAPASAHAELVATGPANGERFASGQPPREVRLSFTETVRAAADAVAIFDERGEQVGGIGAPRKPDDRTVVVALPDLPDGGYVATWRVVSADSHPVQGSFVFTVGAGPEAGASVVDAVAPRSDATVGRIYGVVRAVGFVAALVLAGGLLALLMVWRGPDVGRRVAPFLSVTALLVAVAALLAVVLQAAYASGDPLSTVLRGTGAGDVVGSRMGALSVTRAALALLAIAVLRRLPSGRPAIALIAIVISGALLATFTFGGHAVTGRWQAGAVVLDLAHLAGAAAWLGGVALLVVAFRVGIPVATIDVASARFSRVAAPAIGVVAMTGALQAARQSSGPGDLVTTTYGRLVLAKVVLVGVIVAVASIARRAVRVRAGESAPADGDGTTVPPRLVRLRRAVACEVALAVAVLGVTAALVNTVPAREEAGATAKAGATPFSARIDASGYTVVVRVDPAAVGHNRVTVRLLDAEGRPFNALEVSGSIVPTGRDLAPLALAFVVDAGRATADAHLLFPGDWRLSVRALVSEFDEVVAEVEVPLR